MSFLSLPGELTAHIRDSIPSDDIPSHFALYEAMVSSRIIYDEAFWRRLCFANGIGGIWDSDTRPALWRRTARLIMECRQDCHANQACSSHACTESLGWASAQSQILTPQEVVEGGHKLSTNPIFSSLRLNWRANDPLSAAFIDSNNAEKWSPSILGGHLAAFGFATSPPVSELEINLEEHIPLRYGFEPLIVKRADGVRVRDVVAAIQRWMESSLPAAVRETLIEETKARDEETFRLLEETTDEWTMAAFWERKFRLRRDMVWMHFSGLSVEQDTVVSGVPTVKVAFAHQDQSFTHVGHGDLGGFCRKFHEIGEH